MRWNLIFCQEKQELVGYAATTKYAGQLRHISMYKLHEYWIMLYKNNFPVQHLLLSREQVILNHNFSAFKIMPQLFNFVSQHLGIAYNSSIRLKRSPKLYRFVIKVQSFIYGNIDITFAGNRQRYKQIITTVHRIRHRDWVDCSENTRKLLSRS